ncbi:hydroxyacid oxidase 1 [Trichonephila inaurata madagascariensis]|uniref:(S)-2-hydroxy-acid oxidase n=1 Tax=Trichonephila inaurata madagascariensis TaxID=2747483 RepID=A0A8X6IIX7_9ARAC|nr:hydroxyacid oxidase 1 [Trichonephila inaurata madagascariensis]
MSKIHNFICIEDFEKYALKSLPKMIADYYRGGADNEQTLKENRDAFKRLRFKPRILRDVSKRDLSTFILGKYVSFPVCIAPTAMQCMAHPDGEVATIKGGAAEEVLTIVSTFSTVSLEEVAKASPESFRWFQLYIYTDRSITKDLIIRAEKAGYSAIVVTLDASIAGNRLNDIRNKFCLPAHLRLGNITQEDKSTISASTHTSGVSAYVESSLDTSITWKDVDWIKKITSLPIILKGILTAEDAILAIEHGVDGIVVSNHGARQLDGVPASIEVLYDIVRAVSGRCEVYMDGGIRNGTDVLKALALGAKAVLIGRPVLWGLAHSGESGVRKILQILRRELDIAMALSGCATINEIKPTLVVRQESYSRL